MNILVVNAGSSSLKYQLINTETEVVSAKGVCERIGGEGSSITHKQLLKDIKEIALKYDRGIESLSMSLRHYDGTEEYFGNEWVINLHSDNHSLDAFVQGGEVYSGRVGSAGEIIAEGVTV